MCERVKLAFFVEVQAEREGQLTEISLRHSRDPERIESEILALQDAGNYRAKLRIALLIGENSVSYDEDERRERGQPGLPDQHNL